MVLILFRSIFCFGSLLQTNLSRRIAKMLS